jgi:beta-glucanase (GH16 family)
MKRLRLATLTGLSALIMAHSLGWAALSGLSGLSGPSAVLGGSVTPLDTLSVSAVAAYSVNRKLRLGYSGSAIRVQRTSDSTESDIGFLGTDLDTATLSTFCSGTSCYVMKMYDQSGNGYDATQSLTANAPKIVNAGTLQTVGSRPTAVFDGNDYLGLSGGALGITNDIEGLTVNGVVQYTDDANVQHLYFASTNGSGTTARASVRKDAADTVTSGGRRQEADSFASAVSVGTYVGALKVHTGVFDYTNTDLYQYINGSNDGTNTSFQATGSTPASNSNTMRIGTNGDNSAGMNGNISEVILFQSALSTVNRQLLERNQGSHYALTIAGNLMFEDTFSGAAIDTAKWTTAYWFGGTNAGNNELEWYQNGNCTVSSGTAKLQAKLETVVQGGTTYDYTSCILSSHGKFYQTYGYYEARVKIPAGQGYWPAFWLLAEDRVWPPELDVMENKGSDTTKVYFTNHYTGGQASSTYTGPDFSAGFHTFGMAWTPTYIRWFVDGIQRAEQTTNIPSEDMYVLLNLAVGGDFPGAPDGTTVFPANYEVDHIKVWTVL